MYNLLDYFINSFCSGMNLTQSFVYVCEIFWLDFGKEEI